MPEAPIKLKKKLQAFARAASSLSRAWEGRGDLLIEDYPFQKSFDEISADITGWYEKHVGKPLNAELIPDETKDRP